MKDYKIVSKFLRPDEDFPEGEQWVAEFVSLDTREIEADEQGNYAGFGTDIEDDAGNIIKVKFEYTFRSPTGRERILTQSAPTLYRQIIEKGIKENDTIAIVRIGQGKERRMTIIKKA